MMRQSIRFTSAKRYMMPHYKLTSPSYIYIYSRQKPKLYVELKAKYKNKKTTHAHVCVHMIERSPNLPL